MTTQFRSIIRLTMAFALIACLSFSAARVEAAPEGAASSGTNAAKPHDEHAKNDTMGFKSDLALWSLITFVVFLLVLRGAAWKPLIDGLDARESNIRSQLAQAEAARLQAENMLRDHAKRLEKVEDEVKAIIEEARRDAERTKQDIVETAQKEARLMQDRAIHAIERSRDQALKELFDTMAGQVALATEHVLGRALSGDDQNRLIEEALAQFSSR